jgi:hypothetical protein
MKKILFISLLTNITMFSLFIAQYHVANEYRHQKNDKIAENITLQFEKFHLENALNKALAGIPN